MGGSILSLKKCKECGQEVSTKASVCPHCGAKDPLGRAAKGCLTVTSVLGGFVLLVVIIVAVGIMSDSGKETTKNAPSPSSTVHKMETGHDWVILTPAEKLSVAKRVVKAVRGNDDPALAQELVVGLDTLYRDASPDLLAQPFSEQAVLILALMKGKGGGPAKEQGR